MLVSRHICIITKLTSENTGLESEKEIGASERSCGMVQGGHDALKPIRGRHRVRVTPHRLAEIASGVRALDDIWVLIVFPFIIRV